MVKFHVRSRIIVVLLFGLMSLTLLFQNCAQENFTSSGEAPSYSSGPQAVTLAPKKIPEAAICLQGHIKCFKKVYSPQVKDSTQVTNECTLFNDKEICYPLEVTSYDTTKALQICSDCDVSEGLPKGRYNRQEFTCWLDIDSQNKARFFALRGDLKTALADTLNSCLNSLPNKGSQ